MIKRKQQQEIEKHLQGQPQPEVTPTPRLEETKVEQFPELQLQQKVPHMNCGLQCKNREELPLSPGGSKGDQGQIIETLTSPPPTFCSPTDASRGVNLTKSHRAMEPGDSVLEDQPLGQEKKKKGRKGRSGSEAHAKKSSIHNLIQKNCFSLDYEAKLSCLCSKEEMNQVKDLQIVKAERVCKGHLNQPSHFTD